MKGILQPVALRGVTLWVLPPTSSDKSRLQARNLFVHDEDHIQHTEDDEITTSACPSAQVPCLSLGTITSLLVCDDEDSQHFNTTHLAASSFITKAKSTTLQCLKEFFK